MKRPRERTGNLPDGRAEPQRSFMSAARFDASENA
jgi:hypothetical protein